MHNHPNGIGLTLQEMQTRALYQSDITTSCCFGRFAIGRSLEHSTISRSAPSQQDTVMDR